MKKLLKLLWIIQLVADLRGRSRHSGHRYHGGHHYRRSRDYYPLYRSSHRHSLIEHALRRLLGRRSY